MHRFFTRQVLTLHQSIFLEEDVLHHMRVLRLRDGERVCLFDGKGGEYSGVLSWQTKRQAVVLLDNFHNISRESHLKISLIQAVSTGEKMDWTIQKAVELGVHQIYPVLTDWSSVRLSGVRAEKRHERWQEIAISACEQSGRTTIPHIFPIETLAQLALPEADQSFLLSPRGTVRLGEINQKPKSICLLVGAEGGLSEREEECAIQLQMMPIKLGARILRTETAAISAISAMQTLWGDF